MWPTVVRTASLLRGLVVGGALVGAAVIYAAGGLSAAARPVLPRLVAVADLRPGVPPIRDGAVKVIIEDDSVPGK